MLLLQKIKGFFGKQPKPIPCICVEGHKRGYAGNRIDLDHYFIGPPTSQLTAWWPSTAYSLVVKSYNTALGRWNVTLGQVYRSDRLILEIKRNYHRFYYFWLHHPNGDDYLLCGEDYQGYSIANLTEKSLITWVDGFCWGKVVKFDAHSKELTVEGCVWGAPYERVVYDFATPHRLPLKEISRKYCDEELNVPALSS